MADGGLQEKTEDTHTIIERGNLLQGKARWCTPLVPALRRQSRCEFKASLVHILSSRLVSATWWVPVSKERKTHEVENNVKNGTGLVSWKKKTSKYPGHWADDPLYNIYYTCIVPPHTHTICIARILPELLYKLVCTYSLHWWCPCWEELLVFLYMYAHVLFIVWSLGWVGF